jgi:membrane-associated phospholipid phosphatase
MLGMRPLRFIFANVTSAIGWAILYLTPGIMLGAASLELPPEIAIHVMVVILLISLFILLCLWFTYKILQLIHDQINQLQDWIWGLFKKYHLKPLTSLLQYHDKNRQHGQLGLAFFFILTSTLLFLLALHVKQVGPSAIFINDLAFHLFRGFGLRSNTLDNLMINVTLLGQKQVILPVVVVLFGWLILSKRWRTAFHTIALGILTAGSIFIIKHLVQSPRPWGIAEPISSYSMPSGHTALTASVYMGLAFLIARSIRPSLRWLIYTPAVIIVLLVGLSRLYLGAHWLTDIIASLLLSTSLLTLVIISFQRYAEAPINPISSSLVTVATLMVTFSFYQHQHLSELNAMYKQLNWPTTQITMDEWWGHNLIPAYHTSLFGFPSQRINVEWTGELDDIKQILTNEGWSKPPARNWISTLHRIADVHSTQYLPMVSPQYLDKRPELIMTKLYNNGKALLVLRLWNANIDIKHKKSTIPLWVGIIGPVPSSYGWIFKKPSERIEINSSYLFTQKPHINRWELKIMSITSKTNNKKPHSQNILMIRKK